MMFNAKEDPWGQLLMIVFSVLYGVISWTFLYYGEMSAYLGMTAPIADMALVSWLKIHTTEKGWRSGLIILKEGTASDDERGAHRDGGVLLYIGIF